MGRPSPTTTSVPQTTSPSTQRGWSADDPRWILRDHGIDLERYDDMRWKLAWHAGCSIERLDEVVAHFLRTCVPKQHR